jgi:hypothetical protein
VSFASVSLEYLFQVFLKVCHTTSNPYLVDPVVVRMDLWHHNQKLKHAALVLLQVLLKRAAVAVCHTGHNAPRSPAQSPRSFSPPPGRPVKTDPSFSHLVMIWSLRCIRPWTVNEANGRSTICPYNSRLQQQRSSQHCAPAACWLVETGNFSVNLAFAASLFCYFLAGSTCKETRTRHGNRIN